MSALVFRSEIHNFSVFTCECGCCDCVEVLPEMERDTLDGRFYIRGHQPLGCGWEHIGRRYEFTAHPEPPESALEAFADCPATRTTPDPQKQSHGPKIGLIDDVDSEYAVEWWLPDNAITPVDP